jgi:hypothetical protein
LTKQNKQNKNIMKCIFQLPITAAILLLGYGIGGVSGRTFVDDMGVKHEISGKPRIVVRAGIGALSLYHFGTFREFWSYGDIYILVIPCLAHPLRSSVPVYCF